MRFPTKVGCSVIADFSSAVQEWLRRRPDDKLTLGFSKTIDPYSNGILPITAKVAALRAIGHNIEVLLPSDLKARALFNKKNWAHHLWPAVFKPSESKHDRHLVTRQFKDSDEHYSLVKDFMDVALRNMSMPKDIYSALEWSVSEICDNVINHSNSVVGGFAEVVSSP